MNYSKSIDYLFRQLPMFQRTGAAAYKANLNNTLKICQILGNPQEKIKAIHIAGTNGKGSTAHMISSILQEAGYRTGLFTSPHLRDFSERIRVNGIPIDKEAIIDFVHYGIAAFGEIKPSFFEYSFGMAMDYFVQKNVDIAILETGLGGRLDSTNVCQPVITLITNIGYDHMQFLGSRLDRIAAEKAGIVKPHIPLVIGETQEKTRNVFNEIAQANQAPIFFADQRIKANTTSSDSGFFKDAKIEITKNGQKPMQVRLPLLGDYQLKNIPGVIQVMDILHEKGYALSEENIKQGLTHVITNTGLQGRWQMLSEKPMVICDTAHNEDGIRAVMKQLNKIEKKKLHIVFGMVNDKKTDAILKLLPLKATYYFCKPNVPRGLDSMELKKVAEAAGLKGESFPSVKNALEQAKQNAGPDDVIYIGGSTFVVAEVV